MDIEPKKSYPKFLGVLLALFVPGITHFLTGRRRAGIILLALTILLPIIGLQIAALPSTAAVYAGLAFISLIMPAFSLYILITSWRAIDHMPGRQWAAVIGAVLLLSVFKGALNMVLPVMTYKMPGGSMQPALMGIHTEAAIEETGFLDRLLYGRYAETITAAESGSVTNIQPLGSGFSFDIGGAPHWLPAFAFRDGLKPEYEKGETIWSGMVILGDFILADRLAYFGREPQRGDIAVFSTSGIEHPNVKTNTLYVKRIAGLPGETISIKEGRLMVDGSPATEPEIFQRLNYGNDGELSDAEQTITLGEDEYFVLGDNTEKNMSLDSRFYGPVSRKSILAKVRTVYWPVDRVRVVE